MFDVSYIIKTNGLKTQFCPQRTTENKKINLTQLKKTSLNQIKHLKKTSLNQIKHLF